MNRINENFIDYGNLRCLKLFAFKILSDSIKNEIFSDIRDACDCAQLTERWFC